MRALLLSCLFVLCASAAHAQSMPRPDPAVVGAEAATEAYLASVPADARARSDTYFEGGYWLILWRFLPITAGTQQQKNLRSL